MFLPRSFLLCFGLLLAQATITYAQQRGTNALIEQATSKYADLDYEGSLQLLGEALRVPGNTRLDLLKILHLLGLSLGALERYEPAQAAFERILTLEPAFRLGTDVSPRVRKPFDELVRRGVERLEIQPLPPARAEEGKPLTMIFKVSGNRLGMATGIGLWLRRGDSAYRQYRVSVSGSGEYRIEIPPHGWNPPASSGLLSWYAVLLGECDSVLQSVGDELHPLAIDVSAPASVSVAAAPEETRWYQRWWVWAIIGGVTLGAAAASTAVILGGAPDSMDIPVKFSIGP